MVKEFDDIPEPLMNTKSVQVVKSWYVLAADYFHLVGAAAVQKCYHSRHLKRWEKVIPQSADVAVVIVAGTSNRSWT